MLEFFRRIWQFLFGEPQKADNHRTVNYLGNDPSDPIYMKVIMPPEPPYLKFTVQGFAGSDYSNRNNRQSGNCYITIANNLHFIQNTIAEPLTKWAATNTLRINPRAGKKLNAYYDRRNLKFFYYPTRRETIYTVESTDIIAHELGHAVLDAMRPDFWSVQSLEIWAFHEAFSDINAIITMLGYEKAMERLLKDTRNNIKRSNFISKVGEQVGLAAFGFKKPLRDGVNNFRYVNPARLPKEAPYDQLAAQEHSFGRVFLGTWYEMLTAIYERNVMKGVEPLEALISARDVSFEILLDAIAKSPRTTHYHEALGKTMLSITNNSPYKDIIKDVLLERKIIRPHIRSLSMKHKDALNVDPNDITEMENEDLAVIHEERTIKISDYVRGVQALSVNGVNLSDVELEVPTDKFYLFDKKGNVLDAIEPSESEIVATAQSCVASISNKIGPDEDTMWEVVDNKLVRTFIE